MNIGAVATGIPASLWTYEPQLVGCSRAFFFFFNVFFMYCISPVICGIDVFKEKYDYMCYIVYL